MFSSHSPNPELTPCTHLGNLGEAGSQASWVTGTHCGEMPNDQDGRQSPSKSPWSVGTLLPHYSTGNMKFLVTCLQHSVCMPWGHKVSEDIRECGVREP